MDQFDSTFLENIKIENIMNKKVVTVYDDDDFSKVHVKFVDDHVTHIIVIDNQKYVVGLISQKYLYKTQSPRKVVSEEMEFRPDLLRDGDDSFYTKEMLDSYILSKVMQKDPLMMHPQDNVTDAVLHMSHKKLSCIPIVDRNSKILGVLTHMEIIKFISQFC